jgi:hypothetical protein
MFKLTYNIIRGLTRFIRFAIFIVETPQPAVRSAEVLFL